MTTPRSKKLSSEYHSAIGRLVAASAEIEILLTDLIGVFTEIPDARLTIAAVHHQQASSKTESLTAMMRLVFDKDDQFEPIIEIINQARACCDYRNSIVHAYWHIEDDGTVKTVRFSARGALKRSRVVRTYEEIDEHADEAFEIAEKLADLRDHFLARP